MQSDWFTPEGESVRGSLRLDTPLEQTTLILVFQEHKLRGWPS